MTSLAEVIKYIFKNEKKKKKPLEEVAQQKSKKDLGLLSCGDSLLS